MKEIYPHSSIWPYIMSGLLLFGLVLAPPAEWPQTVREIYVWATASTETPPPRNVDQERVVVEFDPVVQSQPDARPPLVHLPWRPELDASQAVETTPPQLSKPFELQAPGNAAPVGTSDTDQPVDRTTDATPVAEHERLPRSTQNQLQVQLQVQQRPNQRSAGVADSYVWMPPPDWNPRPFRSLSSAEMAAVVSSDKPLMADIQPPVADQTTKHTAINVVPAVERTKLDPNIAPRQPDALPVESLGQSSELDENRIETEPIAEDADPDFWMQDPFEVTQPEAIPPQPESDRSEPQQLANDAHSDSEQPQPDAWPRTNQLHQMLEEASQDLVLSKWSHLIRDTLELLEAKRVSGLPDQVRAVARLEALARLEVDRSQWPLKHRVLHDRVKLSLLRRVWVWKPLMQVAHRETTAFAVYRSQKQIAHVADQLDQALADYESAHGIATRGWSGYLGLEYFRDFQQLDTQQWLQLSEDVLARLHASNLSAAQQQLLQEPMFDDLNRGLRNAIARSIHPAEMMQALEAYESEPNRERADRVINLISRWRSAPRNAIYADSIKVITKIYRNANLRYAVSQKLINRFVPAYQSYAEQVNDRILGAAVRGQNSTAANFSVQLIPDPNRIRVSMHAHGQVQSNTSSRKGPVLLFNRGQSRFSTGKELIVSPEGAYVTPAGTRASTDNRMIGMRTQWDGVPILGWIVRNVARQQHDDKQPQVRREILNKVRRSANQRVDSAVNQQVAAAEKTLETRLLKPLRELRLDPKAMEMRTTADQIIVRSRLASTQQFGSHTARPAASADSLMSFQIHQTAVNNLIEQLELHGQRMTLSELARRLSDRFSVSIEIPSHEHHDTILQFADHHPLEAHFENGRVSITIHFAELDNGKRKWKNFSVRGRYRADIRHLDVELIREEGVELIGERIGLRDQLALRSIFTKIFSKNTRLEVLREAIQKQPKLSHLVVTQFVIRDGWLALALGDNHDQQVTQRTEQRQR